MVQQGPDVKAINPSNGAKFSPFLFEFLSKRRQQASLRLQRVYVDEDQRMWLGYFDDDLFIGALLMQVLCNGAKTQKMAYVKMKHLVEVPNFWEQYQAIGRCAIDPEHRMSFRNDETRWKVQGEQRSCLWCGQAHQRQQQRVVEQVRSEWVQVQPAATVA